MFDGILTNILKFLTKEIMSAQNFNFALKFSPKWVFSNKFRILDENFWTRKRFPDSPKFRIAPLPHDAPDDILKLKVDLVCLAAGCSVVEQRS